MTALAGENGAGKSSVIDALRFVLQTRDGDYLGLQPEDFHIPVEGPQTTQTTIEAKFSDLSVAGQGALSGDVTFNGGATTCSFASRVGKSDICSLECEPQPIH